MPYNAPMAAQQQNIFEGMNIRYFGPIDGHDVKNLARVLRDIKDMQGPKILHPRYYTRKTISVSFIRSREKGDAHRVLALYGLSLIHI